MAIFAKRLKEQRKAQGITQKAVATHLGITEQAYQKYEYAMREPDHKTTIHLAEFFQTSVDYLLGRSNNSAMFNYEKITQVLSDERLKIETKGSYALLLQCIIGNRAIIFNEKLFLQTHSLEKNDFERMLQDLENLQYIHIIDNSNDDITNERHFVLL
ncbi:MAG: helix-turn-helix domain-containing protein [Defluviitaleaceae bacterium]|nr:helix-turn-helix domain-containing protein [Defluviitaleaceae bacterium]MCL2274628.1 helix-turn-helix domain-containing protein [Defluviitaleaceae bacterium]